MPDLTLKIVIPYSNVMSAEDEQDCCDATVALVQANVSSLLADGNQPGGEVEGGVIREGAPEEG